MTRRRVVVPGIEHTQPPVVQLTAGAGAVWATTTAARRLLRIDPRTARLAASLKFPAQGVAADARGVWVVCCQAGARRGQLTRVDPASGRVVAVIHLPGHPYTLGIGPSGVWVCDAGGLVWRVDPTSNRVVATIRLPSSNVDTGQPGGDVAVTKDAVWVSDPAAATVWRIDPQHNQVTDDRWEADGSDLAVAADGVVWATSDVRLLGLGGPEVRGPPPWAARAGCRPDHRRGGRARWWAVAGHADRTVPHQPERPAGGMTPTAVMRTRILPASGTCWW